jgi:hypothetical protein
MRLPVVRGVIDRRILVNYRVDPGVLAPLLPPPFRPKLFRDVALVGICLIRLKQLRPAFLPAWLGVSSENAAHRTAVVWDEAGGTPEGVYVRRRDTNSWLNTLTGGRLFPGFHHHAKFDVRESAEQLSVSMRSDDGETNLSVRGHVTATWPTSSIFPSLAQASAFFEAGSMGYSATPTASRFQGLELRCQNWHVDPLSVDEVRSNFFENEAIFPKGTIEFDCALLMRNIAHEWHEQADLCCTPAAA